VTSIKYVSFAMRVDNDGGGGILALMSLLGVKRQHRPVIVAVGLFGAALINVAEAPFAGATRPPPVLKE
jgi:KUP system potassium uptake protein